MFYYKTLMWIILTKEFIIFKRTPFLQNELSGQLRKSDSWCSIPVAVLVIGPQIEKRKLFPKFEFILCRHVQVH